MVSITRAFYQVRFCRTCGMAGVAVCLPAKTHAETETRINFTTILVPVFPDNIRGILPAVIKKGSNLL